MCILSDLMAKSRMSSSFRNSLSSGVAALFSISAIIEPTSGITKKSLSSLEAEISSTPLSVNSMLLFFSSIEKNKVSSALCISFC